MKTAIEKYDRAWFKNRAIKSLKKTTDGVWDYSDSLLLYLPTGAKQYEQIQKEDAPYFRLVTKPEMGYLKSIAKDIAEILPNDFDYIDLGPGTAHKEQYLFDELKKQRKSFTYIPVDINDHFLNLTASHAIDQGVEVEAIKSSFEELPQALSERRAPRFVSIGLTFSNYHPKDVIKMLKEIANNDGWIFINSQIRDRVDMKALQEIYEKDAASLANEKLQLLELNPDTDVTPRTVDDGFRVWCTVKKQSEVLKKIGIAEGDKLLVFQSLRYTKDDLQKQLENSPGSVLLDNGAAFIGSMIKT